MRHITILTAASVLLVSAILAFHCKSQSPLETWCRDDPAAQWCPEGPDVCASSYQCITYCLENYPDGEGVPSDLALGSWCDDPRLPDYGEFCREQSEVVGCSTWCDSHSAECNGTADGDGDADVEPDGDGDTDADADVEPDGDGDVDADADDEADVEEEPECTDHDGCVDISESRCDDDGECAPCTTDDHCAHIEGLPACNSGTCVLCTADNVEACPLEQPHCLADDHICVACLENLHCPTPQASRCDLDNHTCDQCEIDDHCLHLTETPVCNEGSCVQCTSYDHCSIADGLVCNYTTHLCVEACRECSSSDQCTTLGEGFVCINDWVSPDRRHCFQEAEACERPWALSRGVCLPPVSTTCEGIVDFGATCEVAESIECGDTEFAADGYCLDDLETCTYYCDEGLESMDCPIGTTCGGTPEVCR